MPQRWKSKNFMQQIMWFCHWQLHISNEIFNDALSCKRIEKKKFSDPLSHICIPMFFDPVQCAKHFLHHPTTNLVTSISTPAYHNFNFLWFIWFYFKFKYQGLPFQFLHWHFELFKDFIVIVQFIAIFANFLLNFGSG